MDKLDDRKQEKLERLLRLHRVALNQKERQAVDAYLKTGSFILTGNKLKVSTLQAAVLIDDALSKLSSVEETVSTRSADSS
jgi:hypothetical protein